MKSALNELNQAIVQSAADGIALLDADGNFTFVNPAAAGILGCAPDEIVGRHWSMWVAPELHTAGYEYLERMRQGETVWYEVDVLRPDGTRRVLWASGTPRYDAGEFVGSLAILTDISERTQAQEALAAERTLLRTLIDSLPDLVYAKDTEGRFVLCNQAVAHQLRDPSPEHTLGRSDFDYYPAELAARYWADDASVIKTGQALINQEEAIVEPDGRPGWLLTTKVPLRDGQGAVIGLVGNGRNITERKLGEVALRESEAKFRQFVE